MKLKHSITMTRAAAALLAVGMTAALAGCSAEEGGATSESAATSENAATGESAADPYAYLADFRFDRLFDDKGYLSGITASDYVTLAEGYDAVTLPKELGEVSEADVTEYIDINVLSNFTTTAQVTDRAAADGDNVNIDYVGSIDGVEFSGGNSNGNGQDLLLGSHSFIDTFEEQIAGHMPGETFDVTVTFPEDYQNTDVAGKEAVFSTTLHYINEDVTPELTDEWVAENLKETMGFADVAELKAFVTDTMLFDNQSGDVYSAVLEKATFADELPQEISDFYRDASLYTAYQYAQQYGMTVSDMLTASGFESVDAFMEQYAANLESSVRQQLVMQAIAEDKGITCDSDTLAANFHRFYGTNDPTQYNTYYGENYVKMTMLHNMVMQGLIDNVSYTAE